MEVARVRNPELIREFMTQPKLYERLREDYSPEAEHWAPNLSLSIWVMVYELVDEKPDIIGMFAFAPETPLVYRFHPAIAPKYWGKKSNLKAAQLALRWFWENTSAEKVVGKAPVLYPDVLRWAQRLGMKREGVQRASFQKNGVLHDQYHMGLNRQSD